MKQLQSQFRSNRRFQFSVSLALLVLLFSLTYALIYFLSPQLDVARAQDIPASAQISETAATAHDTLLIPSIGLTSEIVTVGRTSGNAIDVHPSLVGWWNESAQPGKRGAVFLDGHNPGVFSSLPEIEKGAEISLITSGGKEYDYTVVHHEIVSLAGINMREALSVYGNAKEGLNIMTCVGEYNPKINTTSERLIVYAVRS